MCFSAQASFGTSIVLLTIGFLTIRKNKNQDMKLFSYIPLLFGIQQFFEGVIWSTQADQSLIFYTQLSTYAFLFFAYIVWPVFIPLTAYLMETRERKKRCLASFIGIGTVVSSGLFWIMICNGAVATILCDHISYLVNVPEVFNGWSLFWYIMATLVPFFISSKKYMREFGIIVGLSALISFFFYSYYFTSVWCFFSALISSIIFFLL